MPTPKQESKDRDRDQEKQVREQRHALIGKHVIQTLGQPRDFFQVQVRYVGPDRFRVNVLVGADAASVKIAHSYFLVADRDGNIITSTPALLKEY
jgi:hypothetical protein